MWNYVVIAENLAITTSPISFFLLRVAFRLIVLVKLMFQWHNKLTVVVTRFAINASLKKRSHLKCQKFNNCHSIYSNNYGTGIEGVHVISNCGKNLLALTLHFLKVQKRSHQLSCSEKIVSWLRFSLPWLPFWVFLWDTCNKILIPNLS